MSGADATLQVGLYNQTRQKVTVLISSQPADGANPHASEALANTTSPAMISPHTVIGPVIVPQSYWWPSWIPKTSTAMCAIALGLIALGILQRGWLSNNGPVAQEFEHRVASFIKTTG